MNRSSSLMLREKHIVRARQTVEDDKRAPFHCEDFGAEVFGAGKVCEPMAAREEESDLDFAFRVQLHEAMAASIDSEAQKDIASVLQFQKLELERFQQETEDRELSEKEMRRASYGLKCCLHDAIFAREINYMCDEQWNEHGDNFHRPVDEGTSSSPFMHEPFRLYIKGMVTTESVGGSMVPLAAMGIAICDPHDSLILKIQKPVNATGLSHAVAETTTLIEGLKAALLLDIQRLDVFFDFVPLYNYAILKWTPKQRKILDLLDQMFPLQRQFEACRFFILPRCHVKFVFRLARDAIDSQITKSVDASTKKNLTVTCTICLNESDLSQMFVLEGCLHQYCFSCMRQHVEVKLLHGLVPGCPHEHCNIKLNVDNAKKFLSPKLLETLEQRIGEASIPEDDKIYCPYPKCSVLMSKSKIVQPEAKTSFGHQRDEKSGLRTCVKCHGYFCVSCKVPWHFNMSCYDYKRLHPHPRPEDAKLHSLAKQRLWRQCVKCSHMIELAEGCFHMTCRCSYEFCYTCGAEWKNKKATCKCPLFEYDDYFDGSQYDDEDEFYEEDYDDDWF